MLSLAFLAFPVRGTGRAIWLSLVFSALLYEANSSSRKAFFFLFFFSSTLPPPITL